MTPSPSASVPTPAPDFARLASQARSIYVHVPFCAHRCGYCIFTLVAGRDYLIEDYLAALARELNCMSPGPRPVHTLYLGGGTPSHLSAVELQQLLELLTRHFQLDSQSEFCLEANPLDITAERVRVMQEFGVNRISLGAQSFRAGKLQFLERDHQAADIERAIELLAPAIPNLSLDLIFGVPQESATEWHDELTQALSLPIRHLSAYSLTIEKGSQFFNRSLRDQIMTATDERVAELYELTMDFVTGRGWEHYEISSYALPGSASRHNRCYWNGQDYLGLGPGAASYADAVRWTNHASVSRYLQRVSQGQSPVENWEALEPELRARERLIFGMRQIEGIELQRLERETGFPLQGIVPAEKLEWLFAQGLLEQVAGRLRLTRRGLLVSDAIWVELI